MKTLSQILLETKITIKKERPAVGEPYWYSECECGFKALNNRAGIKRMEWHLLSKHGKEGK